MKEQGMKMTTYIVNFLIKGCMNGGGLLKVRVIFEGLADQPHRMAAPGNHAPPSRSSCYCNCHRKWHSGTNGALFHDGTQQFTVGH